MASSSKSAALHDQAASLKYEEKWSKPHTDLHHVLVKYDSYFTFETDVFYMQHTNSATGDVFPAGVQVVDFYILRLVL